MPRVFARRSPACGPAALPRPPARLRRRASRIGGLLLGLCLLALPARSESKSKPRVDQARPEPKTRSVLQRVSRHISRIAREGDSCLYLSGYAYHLRRTYGPDLVETLSETAWGAGYGKTLRTPSGSAASLAFTVFLDSVGEMEYNLGYMREWYWSPFDPELTLGAGLSAVVMSRPDYFDGVPFPAVLPQLSLGYRDATLIAMFVPRIPVDDQAPGNLPAQNGDIIYLFGRFTLP